MNKASIKSHAVIFAGRDFPGLCFAFFKPRMYKDIGEIRLLLHAASYPAELLYWGIPAGKSCYINSLSAKIGLKGAKSLSSLKFLSKWEGSRVRAPVHPSRGACLSPATE